MCKSYRAIGNSSILAGEQCCKLVDNLQLDTKICSTATISSLAAAIPVTKGRSL